MHPKFTMWISVLTACWSAGIKVVHGGGASSGPVHAAEAGVHRPHPLLACWQLPWRRVLQPQGLQAQGPPAQGLRALVRPAGVPLEVDFLPLQVMGCPALPCKSWQIGDTPFEVITTTTSHVKYMQ